MKAAKTKKEIKKLEIPINNKIWQTNIAGIFINDNIPIKIPIEIINDINETRIDFKAICL